MTQNVRGLNDDMVVQSLWMYRKDFTPNLDILFLQKHKLRGEKAKNLGVKVWKEVKSWYLKASSR
jgi:hypothetical protein